MADLIDQFFESKMEKVRQNEEMIVSSQFEPKIKQAKFKLKAMEEKVKDQQIKMTSQQELA